MTERRLHLAPRLSLLAETFLESKSAVLGASGGGKSGALKVIEEELVAAKLPFIVFDPAGIAWGLRSSVDGKGAGLPILVIGGEHGDLELNRKAGAEYAREVVRTNAQVIFDLSDESTEAYREFLTDFCEALYREQGKSRTPRLLIIDEAHEILPQDVGKADARMYGAVKRIVTRGRNRGLGVCLVSQRPASISKTVLTQCGTLLIFGLLGTPDRKAVGDWVAAWGDQKRLEEFDSGLAALRQQECYVWSPRDFRVFERIRIRDFRTFHPDYTHLRKAGLLKVEPVRLGVADLVGRFSKEIAKVRQEKVEASEVPALRAKVTDLERKLKERGPVASVDIDPVKFARAVEDGVRVATAELRGRNQILTEELAEFARWHIERVLPATVRAKKATEDLAKILSELLARLTKMPIRASVPESVQAVTSSTTPPRSTSRFPEIVASIPRPTIGTGDDSPKPLYAGQKKMLVELVRRYPKSLNRAQLGTLAGYSIRSSTFDIYTRDLVTRGLVVRNGDGFTATHLGISATGEVDPEPKTHERILAEWSSKLYKGEAEMLRALAKARPHTLSREELGSETGYSVSSSTFDIYTRHLVKLGLVDRTPEGGFVASNALWPEG